VLVECCIQGTVLGGSYVYPIGLRVARPTTAETPSRINRLYAAVSRDTPCLTLLRRNGALPHQTLSAIVS